MLYRFVIFVGLVITMPSNGSTSSDGLGFVGNIVGVCGGGGGGVAAQPKFDKIFGENITMWSWLCLMPTSAGAVIGEFWF